MQKCKKDFKIIVVAIMIFFIISFYTAIYIFRLPDKQIVFPNQDMVLAEWEGKIYLFITWECLYLISMFTAWSLGKLTKKIYNYLQRRF